MVWAESRFLTLIAEQVMRIPGPHLLLWGQGPWQWLSDEPVPFRDPTTNPVHHWLQTDPRANVFEVVKLPGGPAVADDLALEQETRNHALEMLAGRGIDVCLWFDADYLMTFADVENIVAQIQGQAPRAWSVPAYHYFRTFQHCHAVTPARLATTTAVRYPEAFSEPDALLEGVRLHHASYVLSDAEVVRKFRSWGHAQLARDQRWEDNWLRGDDSAWAPVPAPEVLPYEIARRLDWHHCLLGGGS